MASEPINEMFWSKHGVDRRAVAALSEQEVEHIEAIVRGRVDSSNRARALEILALARGAEAIGALIDTTADQSLESPLRAAAVVYLGRIGGPEVERVLIELARETSDLSVALRAAQALAKTGSPDALRAFDALTQDEDPSVRRRATFARSVLAYRHGIGDFELPAPDPEALIAPPHAGGVRVRSERASIHEAARALEDLTRDSYGVRLTRDDIYAIDCGPTRMLLALDSPKVHAVTYAGVDRPQLLGLVADRSPEDGSYSVKWLAFSTPAEQELRLAVHRQTGEHVLYGAARTGSSSAEFELNAVATIGNPAVTVTGKFANGHLSLSGTSAASAGVAGGRAKNIPFLDKAPEEAPPAQQ